MIHSSINDCIEYLRQENDIVCEISCDYPNFRSAYLNLYTSIHSVYQEAFENNQRLIFTITEDFYHKDKPHGITLGLLQSILNDIDISNFFICVVTTNPDIFEEYKVVHQTWNQDAEPINLFYCHGKFSKKPTDQSHFTGKMQSIKNISTMIQSLTEQQKNLLFVNDSFCIMPWIGINVSTDSSVRPCCQFRGNVGNLNNQNLKEVWNNTPLKNIRQTMLSGQLPNECLSCHTKEALGIDSLRQSINRDFAHCINIVDSTVDGHNDKFSIRYWDIRYNNLCNFVCRSCDSTSSSSWYQLHNKIYPDRPLQTALLEAGNDQDKTFSQVVENIDHIEKIYFAGGEPSMIENFYRILELLDQHKRHNVHLTYNINLSKLSLKHWNLADIWQRFPNISIGASLDAEGARAEYLRSGTIWKDIVNNRKILLEKCPHIDFYVSATTGLINALHIPDFHKSWVEQGLIKPWEFNIQLLFSPEWMSIKNAPEQLKSKVIDKYQKHLSWLTPLDTLGRSTSGFQSIINLCRTPNAYNQQEFWIKVNQLDTYHNTKLLDYFPELSNCGL